MAYLVCFLGGLSVLLLGIHLISSTLEKYQSHKVKILLSKFTDCHLKGFFFGTIVTMFLQSSSAITVLTIGFVNANLLKFTQTIGIILGTNVGTTFTTQLIAFDLGNFWFFILISGMIFCLLPFSKIKPMGKILFFFGIILAGLNLMAWAASPLKSNPLFVMMWSKVDNHTFYGILVGLLSTAILQSSSGVTAILLAISPHGYLDLPTAMAIVLGTNIGTCFTAILAVIHSSRAAQKVALAHLVLNIGGVIIFLPFFSIFCTFIESTSSSLPRQIANAQTIFNLISSLLVLPVANHFGRFISWLYEKML
ncbi:MAG: Na/Pi symporter [Bacillota bacterium]